MYHFSADHLKVSDIVKVHPEIPQQTSSRMKTFCYITVTRPMITPKKNNAIPMILSNRQSIFKCPQSSPVCPVRLLLQSYPEFN